jgi:dTDP-4-dehydrorhamnose reductase
VIWRLGANSKSASATGPGVVASSWAFSRTRTVTQTAKVSTTSTMSHAVTAMAEPIVQPLLITGSTGTLGAAFARICDARHIAYQLTSRTEVDIADAVSVENAIAKFKPWAIINAAGYVRVDEAESDRARCFRENALGPAVLAHACAKHQIKLHHFFYRPGV